MHRVLSPWMLLKFLLTVLWPQSGEERRSQRLEKPSPFPKVGWEVVELRCLLPGRGGGGEGKENRAVSRGREPRGPDRGHIHTLGAAGQGFPAARMLHQGTAQSYAQDKPSVPAPALSPRSS